MSYGAVPEEVVGLVINSAAQNAVSETQESIEKARVLLEQGPLTLRWVQLLMNTTRTKHSQILPFKTFAYLVRCA
jgi:hypothetical protein